MFMLRNTTRLQGSGDQGFADLTFMYGSAHGNLLPLAGTWTVQAAAPLSAAPAVAPSGVTCVNIQSMTSVTDSIRLAVPTEQSQTPVTAAGNIEVGSSVTSNVSNGTLQVQSQVSPQALGQIDPSTVAGSVVGPQSLDAVADDLVSGTLAADVSHTDAALTL